MIGENFVPAKITMTNSCSMIGQDLPFLASTIFSYSQFCLVSAAIVGNEK